MTCRPIWLLWLALLTVAVPASAHPGHGTPGGESLPSHYVTEPVHALFLVAAVAAGLVVSGWIAQRSFRDRHRV